MTVKRFKHHSPSGDIEFIQGFDELLDAERAKAREEQREACALAVERHDPELDLVAFQVRSTLLTATPLADRIAVLEKDRALSVQLCDVLGREVGKTGESEGAVQVAERIIRERDEARAKCAEWEEKAKAWMASPEAAAQMSGYRELADRIAELERERDEARAEAVRLAELHPRCEAYDDQPGPSCVEWKARALKAEEALADLRDQADAVERWSTRP